MHTHIPVELYRTILRHVTQEDLHKFLLVSHDFGSEAELALWANLDLHMAEIEKVHQWCLVTVASPHRAKMVKHLCLNNMASVSTPASSEDFLVSLQKAFVVMVNLTHLRFKPGHDYGIYLTSEIFEGSTFQLQQYSDPEGLALQPDPLEFLRLQPSIHDWCPGRKAVDVRSQHRSQQLDELLPHLSAVQLHITAMHEFRLIKLLASRPIQRIRIATESDTIRDNAYRIPFELWACGATLTRLDLNIGTYRRPSVSNQNERWTIELLLASVGDKLPTLEFLRYSQNHEQAIVRVSSHCKITLLTHNPEASVQ